MAHYYMDMCTTIGKLQCSNLFSFSILYRQLCRRSWLPDLYLILSDLQFLWNAYLLLFYDNICAFKLLYYICLCFLSVKMRARIEERKLQSRTDVKFEQSSVNLQEILRSVNLSFFSLWIHFPRCRRRCCGYFFHMTTSLFPLWLRCC